MGKGATEFRKWKACERKRRYATQAKAFQKGQESYRCRYCGFWHRSGSLSKLAAKVSK
jgi:hypothetical protein